MTENEALEELKTFPTNCLDFKENQALQVAIQALEEIQQYKALGTLEEIRFMKTVYEMSDDMYNSLCSAVREKMAYQAIGTVEEFKMLKERLADDGK